MSRSLCLCQNCKRHVRADAATCPFCHFELRGHGVATTLGFALTAGALALSAQGCDPASKPEPPVVAVYGPPPMTAQVDAGVAPPVTPQDASTPPVPAYGPPPVPPTAAQDASTPPVPAYGPPPVSPDAAVPPPTPRKKAP